jgi:hypothetical protein
MFWVRILPRGCVLNTALCDQVCQWRTEDQWLSQDTAVSSTNKTDNYDRTEILLKVALNTQEYPEKITYLLQVTIQSYHMNMIKLFIEYTELTILSNDSHYMDVDVRYKMYAIKFVSDLRQVGGFLCVFWFPSPIKLTATIKLKYCWKWC